MLKARKFINKLSQTQKFTCLVVMLLLVLLVTIGIPSLARFKNRSTINTVTFWDGSIASSYHKGTGTQNDPYIISNGAELSYFGEQLTSYDYENTYFKLSNDIALNNGVFDYDTTDGIKYILDNETYYIANYSNKYYDNNSHSGTEIGTVNLFDSLNGFKGYFDGGSFTIYGLYVTSETKAEMALFTDLQGDIKDLYVENTIIYGGTITAGIASTTNNNTLTNILFNGHIIGKSNLSNQSINTIPTISVINLQSTETTNYIDLTNDLPFIGSEISSTTITGNYTFDGTTDAETIIKINGVTVTGGIFEVDLGSSIRDNINVATSTTSIGTPTLTFTNLKYNITYKYGVSGGIIAKSDNTAIVNTINKATVYGYSVSGGLVGVTTNANNITRSYNTGNISSTHISGGLIGVIEKNSQDMTISRSYNTGSMMGDNFGGLIGMTINNTGIIAISDTFNTSATNYSIDTITNTTVNVTNSYFVNGLTAVNTGSLNSGSFDTISMDNLNSKAYMISNMLFNEFITFTDLEINNNNAWVYEDNTLPILFIDDIKNPIANINVNVYSWNNLSYELSPIKLQTNITFSIEEKDILRPLKEIYYYVSNTTIPLSSQEINQISTWQNYSSIVQITEEGTYVIYAKVVDYDDNVTYLNTDLLILDLPGASININMDDHIWTNLNSNLNYIYVDKSQTLTIEASNDISGISSVAYYITNSILSQSALEALSESNWTTYDNSITIDEIGTYIVYAKIIDSYDYATYLNTDYIVYNGYVENNLTIGRNASSYLNAESYITDKSSITLNTSFSNINATELTGYTHNLITNILLPKDSKITLIDNIKHKVYEYLISTNEDIYDYNNSCDPEDLDCVKVSTIPFTLFKEVGAEDKPYTEDTYYDNGSTTEDFTIVLDLSNTNILVNYENVVLYMELHNNNGDKVRPTLFNTIKNFNIYSNVDLTSTQASLYLDTDYSGNTINFNSDATTDINIDSAINYKYIGEHKIIDTTYEDKEIGLLVKLVDSNGVIVSKDYLKNVIFKIGTDIYSPDDDNNIRISLKNGIADVSTILSIITSDNDNNELQAGTYYFKITSYASYDGYYNDETGNMEISIPVNVTNDNINIPYSFNANMDDTKRIINKTDTPLNIIFDIMQSGSLDNPNIRVSLYKKDSLTAYNQNYSIVNLTDYVSNTLEAATTNIYYVSKNPTEHTTFELNLIPTAFENTGYKWVFTLYDGTKKIGTIEKYFIVK